MANFENHVLTTNGLRLMTKSLSGNAADALKLTKMAVGRGVIPDNTDVKQMTDLYQRVDSISPTGFLDIMRFDITGLGASQVTCLVTNDKVSQQTPIFSVGVYAHDPESNTDVLYEIAYTHSTPAIIDPPNPTVFSVELSLVTIIGEAENVVANIVFPMNAGSVRYDNAKSKLVAGNVQTAIDELKSISDSITTNISNINSISITTAGTALSKAGNTLNHQNYGTSGTYAKVTTNEQGHVTSGTTLTATDIPNLDWAKITSGKPSTASGYGITDSITAAGIGLSKSGVTLNHANYGAAGTYSKVKTNEQGHVIAGSNLDITDIPNLPWSKITGTPSTLAGYGISDNLIGSAIDCGLWDS